MADQFTYDKFNKRLDAAKFKANRQAGRLKSAYNLTNLGSSYLETLVNTLQEFVLNEHEELSDIAIGLQDHDPEQACNEADEFFNYYQQAIADGMFKLDQLNDKSTEPQEDKPDQVGQCAFHFDKRLKALDRCLTTLNTALSNDQSLGIVTSYYEDAKGTFESLTEVWGIYSTLLSAGDRADKEKEYDEVEAAFVNLKGRYFLFKDDKQRQRQQQQSHSNTPPPTAPQANNLDKNIFQKVQLPKFNGDRKLWVSFYKTWTTIVEKQYTDDITRALVLRSHLTDDALKTVERVEDDYKLMMKKLDKKYGDRVLLSQSILETINMSSIPEGNTRRFVEFVEQVSDAYDRLQLRGEEHSLTNVFTYHKLMEALPRSKYEQWKLEMLKLTPDERASPFNKFMAFLENHSVATMIPPASSSR